MRRALVWLNLYGHEAVRHKLKNRQKMHFLCFYAIFGLMSASLTAKLVEPNQCPSHQSILLTQGPIPLNLAKKYWELTVWQNEVFLSWPFWIFFFEKKNFFFALFPWKSAQIYMVEWMGWNFDVFPGFQKIPCYA